MATLGAIRNNEPTTNANAARVDMKLEVVIIPVSDVDRAKEFYAKLEWRLDGDFAAGDDWRGVQFTPPGSGCSVIFGKNVTPAAPGSAQGLYLAVSDIEAARKDLLGRGIKVSDVFHGTNVHTGDDEPYYSDVYGSAVRTRRIPVIPHSLRSMIRTGTAGSCKSSRPGCRGEESVLLTFPR